MANKKGRKKAKIKVRILFEKREGVRKEEGKTKGMH